MNTFEWTPELRFLVALALGFLVGLERESTKLEEQKMVFGGVRTHPIISMLGFGCAWFYKIGAPLMLPVGLISIAALTSIAYIAKIKVERFGSTSEISALLTFVTGALALLVDVWIAMAIGVVNTILLSEKAALESYVERLNKVEFLATVKFLLVTVIILPVLPNEEYTSFKLNPTRIWQIVILVSSIGFVGYFLSKKFGQKVGMWLSGALGGAVSSTALTMAVGRIAQKNPSRANEALQAAVLAGSVMYLRILILIWLINGSIIPILGWRLVVLFFIGVALSARIAWQNSKGGENSIPAPQNPFEIRPAMAFAALFVILSVVTGLVQKNIGNAGVLGLAGIVGVTDIDPFILSLVHDATAVSTIVVPAVIIAMMSNTIAKGAYFAVLSPSTRKQTALTYGLWALLHVPLIVIGT
ncbi:MAG TPA: MgtC/SapB family protein [Bacteroidota bacterium]|nr:MgtC/SapB family protein [Bacteroidota bacterium]